MIPCGYVDVAVKMIRFNAPRLPVVFLFRPGGYINGYLLPMESPQRISFFAIIDLLTRYVSEEFLRNMDQESIVGEFLDGRVRRVGFLHKDISRRWKRVYL